MFSGRKAFVLMLFANLHFSSRPWSFFFSRLFFDSSNTCINEYFSRDVFPFFFLSVWPPCEVLM